MHGPPKSVKSGLTRENQKLMKASSSKQRKSFPLSNQNKRLQDENAMLKRNIQELKQKCTSLTSQLSRIFGK